MWLWCFLLFRVDTGLLVAKIICKVAEITFKEAVITSSVAKITFLVAKINFTVAVITSSVAKITTIVTERTLKVVVITLLYWLGSLL